MKNFIQPGGTLTLTAPYAVTSGQGALVGAIFGVAVKDVANGAAGEFVTEGVFSLAKAAGAAWTQGALLYWDNSNKNVTTTSSGNTKIGVATAPADSAATVGNVRLNGAW